MLPRHVRLSLLAVATTFVLATLVPRLLDARLPGNNTGYAPEQPIAYSHRLHAGELGIDCHYCHTGAERSRHAGIPSASVCMNCHKSVRATLGAQRAEEEDAKEAGRSAQPVISEEIAKIHRALGLDAELKPDPKIGPSPIRWKQVHRLPDYAYFNHSVHVGAGVACETCHGPVETMERVRQVERLSMGWCVECHRDVNTHGIDGREVHASNDCAACHY